MKAISNTNPENNLIGTRISIGTITGVIRCPHGCKNCEAGQHWLCIVENGGRVPRTWCYTNLTKKDQYTLGLHRP